MMRGDTAGGRVEGRRQAWGAAAGLATLCTALFLALPLRSEIDRFTHLIFDAYQRAEPRQAALSPVALIDIDEVSIARLGQWPWPRDLLARMVDRLDAMGAAAIVFDILFADPDRTSLARAIGEIEALGASVLLPQNGLALDNDAALAAAFARARVVAGIAIGNQNDAPLPAPKAGFAFGGTSPGDYLPAYRGGIANIEVLSQAATGLGSLSFVPARDNIVRTMPLIISAQDRLYPALSIEALRVAQDSRAYALRSNDASGEIGGGAPGLAALRVGALEVPVGPHGEFWVHYSGMPHMPIISAADLLDPEPGEELAALLADRIILVGTSAVGLHDIVATPISPATPGVMVHAEVIDQIVAGDFLIRPDWASGVELAVAVLAGLALIALTALAGPAISALGLVALAGGIGFGSWQAFSAHGLLLDPVLALLGLAAFSR